MRTMIYLLKNGWRTAVSIIFVLLMLAVPNAKGIFADYISQTVAAGGNHNNPDSRNNSGHSGSRSSRSRQNSHSSVPSVSAPSSRATASPDSYTHSSRRDSSCTSRNHSHGDSRSLRDGGANKRPPNRK
jgi:hypothetical protein